MKRSDEQILNAFNLGAGNLSEVKKLLAAETLALAEWRNQFPSVQAGRAAAVKIKELEELILQSTVQIMRLKDCISSLTYLIDEDDVELSNKIAKAFFEETSYSEYLDSIGMAIYFK